MLEGTPGEGTADPLVEPHIAGVVGHTLQVAAHTQPPVAARTLQPVSHILQVTAHTLPPVAARTLQPVAARTPLAVARNLQVAVHTQPEVGHILLEGILEVVAHTVVVHRTLLAERRTEKEPRLY